MGTHHQDLDPTEAVLEILLNTISEVAFDTYALKAILRNFKHRHLDFTAIDGRLDVLEQLLAAQREVLVHHQFHASEGEEGGSHKRE